MKFKYYFRVVMKYLIHNSWSLTEIDSELDEFFYKLFMLVVQTVQISSTELHIKGQGCLCGSLLSIEHNLSCFPAAEEYANLKSLIQKNT